LKCNLKTVKGQMAFGDLKEVSKQKHFATKKQDEDWKVDSFQPKTLKNQFEAVIKVAEKKLQEI